MTSAETALHRGPKKWNVIHHASHELDLK